MRYKPKYLARTIYYYSKIPNIIINRPRPLSSISRDVEDPIGDPNNNEANNNTSNYDPEDLISDPNNNDTEDPIGDPNIRRGISGLADKESDNRLYTLPSD